MTDKKKLLKKIALTTIVAFSSLIFISLFSLSELYSSLNSTIYDIFFRMQDKEHNKTKNIAIIEINDISLANAQERGLLWPWPRNLYAVLSKYLIEDGAKAVVFDIIFSSPDIDRLDGFGEDNDIFFSEIISESDKIVLSFNIEKNYDTNSDIFTKNISNASQYKNISEYKSVLPIYEMFSNSSNNFGFVDTEGERDGVIRQYKPFVKIEDKYYPSLATATYLITEGDKLPDDLVLNKKGSFILNWYGEGGYDINELGELASKPTMSYYSFWHIFYNAVRKSRGLELENLEPNTFKDKVVFIGASARGLLDQKQTPYTIGGKAYPGVEIHTTAYLNLVHRDWIRYFNPFLEIFIYLFIFYFLIFFGLDAKSFVKYSVFFAMILVVIIAFQYFVFSLFRIEMRIVYSFVFLFLSFISTLLLNYIIIGSNRNKIKHAFDTYLSPDLLKTVAESEKPLTTGGEECEASSLFIDIQGFTTFSEKNPVGKVVEILNEYLKAFSEIIINNKGLVNKFLGDGLMALFGVPTHFNEHSDMAVKSAFECYRINNELSKDYGLNVRIGVNSGKMIVGNMGGGKRLEYTAIGDNVNLASRLEGANKFFNTRIIVGENSYNTLKDKSNLYYLGKFSVKGKDNAIGFYYFGDYTDEEIYQFDKMVKAYESNDLKNFELYMKYFENREKPFGPAKFYIDHFKEFNTIGKPIKLTEK